MAMGAVLEQFAGGLLRPLAFFSRQLRKPETKYSAFNQELLAMHLSIRHFWYFLDGRPFTVYPDHKPLTFAFSKISDPWSARQQRQLAAISEFTTDIRHIAGKANAVAGTLSRTQISSVISALVNLDYTAMAAAQTCLEVQAVLEYASTVLVLEYNSSTIFWVLVLVLGTPGTRLVLVLEGQCTRYSVKKRAEYTSTFGLC